MENNSLKEITVGGSAYEMGLAQGLEFQGERENLLQTLVDSPFFPPWPKWGQTQILRALLTAKGFLDRRWVVPKLKRFTPRQWDRLQGITRGMGSNLSLMLGLCSLESMAATFSYVMGCTSLAVSPGRSKSGSPLLAYNHDFPYFLKPMIFVRRSEPKEGFRSLQLTYPNLPGCIAGVNEKGLALTLNHAFSAETKRPGVPPSFLVQEALDRCRSVEEVKRLFEGTPFACGSMVTVLDRKGEMLALELAIRRFGVRKETNGISLTLNEYQLDPLKEIEVPKDALFNPGSYPTYFRGLPIHQANWERRERFMRLLPPRKKLDASELKAFLSDHNGSKKGSIGSICRHHKTAETIATAVLYPKEGRIEAARGSACRARHQLFTL